MRKSLAAVVATFVAVAAVVVATAPAGTANAAAGCRVDYVVNSQWTGGFTAGITITNLGDPAGSVLTTPTPSRTTSTPIADWPAVVTLLSPAAGAVYTAPVTIPLAATATVGGGHAITSVSFRVDGVTVAPGVPTTGNRYEAQWTPPAGEPGTSRTFAVSASAGTSQSLPGGAPPVLITVVTPALAGTNHPPAVALSNPGGQTFFLEPTTVTLVADATDADSGDVINRAELYLGTTLIATTATNSGLHYRFQVNLAAATSYTFTVRVYDSNGGIGISNPLGFSVR